MRTQDPEAVGIEEPADRLRVDVDRELGGDEPGHLELGTIGVVDEVLGDRPGVLRMQVSVL